MDSSIVYASYRTSYQSLKSTAATNKQSIDHR